MLQHPWFRIVVLTTIGAFALLGGLVPMTSAHAAAIDEGDYLPSHVLYDSEDNAYNLSEIVGRVLLIAFLGHSCQVCVDIARSLEEDFDARYYRDGLRIYVIDALDGANDQFEHFRNEAGVRYPMLRNGGGFLSACDLPWLSFLVVDGEGVVRYVSEGPEEASYDPEALSDAIDQYISGAAAVDEKTWGAIKGLYSTR